MKLKYMHELVMYIKLNGSIQYTSFINILI